MNTDHNKVDIYYARICGLCTKAVDFFRSRGVTFTSYGVEWDGEKDAFVDSENTREMYKRCGEEVDFVPQIFIGDLHIKGWRALEPMIESGEIDALIPKP
jgi:glutaredoxin